MEISASEDVCEDRNQYLVDLIALLDPYLSKSCGYGPLTNLNTKQTLMF